MLRSFFTILVFSLLITGCSIDPLEVDVSNVDVDIAFTPYHKKMYATKSVAEMKLLNEEMIKEGGELYEFYVSEILRSGSVNNDSVANYLMYFIQDTIIEKVFVDIETNFGELGHEKSAIVDLFKHFKFHLPNFPQPAYVMFYNSAFSYGVTSTESKIGVGLEMYLGEDNRIIQKLGYPAYMKRKMDADYLLVDIAHSWLNSNVLIENNDQNFLQQMIYFGKLRYCIEACLPELDDHYILRYTETEFDFCLASEYDVWQYLVDMNWLYSTEVKVKMRFFNEAPETVGIENSPGRLGQFMGWRMIKNYVDLNSDITFEELLFNTPENKILKAYKPNKND